jgi:cyclopropane-fatty-acyl-phospholipid synthase
MNAPEHILPLQEPLPATAKVLFGLLKYLQYGTLTVTTPAGGEHTFTGRHPGPRAELIVHDWKAVGKMLSAADIGIAESWRDGLIQTHDMTGFLDFCVANEAALESVFYGNPATAFIYRLYHLLRPNTRRGSQKNIHAHYDLGNNFYKLWLDASMTYSAGIYSSAPTGERTALEQAQFNKYDRICRELDLKPGQTVLEIGCGWGGFAEHAATHYGAIVDGITISKEQLAWGKERITRAGLDERVTLRYCDYRDLKGRYDHIVSIEMIEAVGERYWPTYFKTIHDNLKPGGSAMLQAIVIDDAKFESYRKTSDFIREYIFPGGMLLSPKRLQQEAQSVQLECERPFYFGPDYGRTLRDWDALIDQSTTQIKALGFDDKFLKTWKFYFYYCDAGFKSGRIDVMQIKLNKISR